MFPPSLLLLAVLDGRDVVSRCVGVLLRVVLWNSLYSIPSNIPLPPLAVLDGMEVLSRCIGVLLRLAFSKILSANRQCPQFRIWLP